MIRIRLWCVCLFFIFLAKKKKVQKKTKKTRQSQTNWLIVIFECTVNFLDFFSAKRITFSSRALYGNTNSWSSINGAYATSYVNELVWSLIFAFCMIRKNDVEEEAIVIQMPVGGDLNVYEICMYMRVWVWYMAILPHLKQRYTQLKKQVLVRNDSLDVHDKNNKERESCD